MANYIYGKALEAFLKADIDVLVDDVKFVLVDAGAYTDAQNTDEFLSDIPSGARIATSASLASKTATLGVFDAADTVFTAVSGVQSEILVGYSHTGTAGTSRLHCKYDASVTNLPVTPNGGDITFAFPNDTNKIYKI